MSSDRRRSDQITEHHMKTFVTSKKLILGLALCGLFVMQASATVDYNFSYSDGVNSIRGVLSGTDLGGGQINITSGTETFSGTINGTFSIVQNPISPTPLTLGPYTYDDLLLPASDPVITTYGMLWSANGNFVQLRSGGSAGNYALFYNNNPVYSGPATVSATLVPVPEASTFAVAGVVLLGVVYVGRSYARKTKVA